MGWLDKLTGVHEKTLRRNEEEREEERRRDTADRERLEEVQAQARWMLARDHQARREVQAAHHAQLERDKRETLMLDSGVLCCNMAQGSQLNVKTLEK